MTVADPKCRACIEQGIPGECTDPAHQVAPEIGPRRSTGRPTYADDGTRQVLDPTGPLIDFEEIDEPAPAAAPTTPTEPGPELGQATPDPTELATRPNDVQRLIAALWYTAEYADLPPRPGWAWWDTLTQIAPDVATQYREQYQRLHPEPADSRHQVVDAAGEPDTPEADPWWHWSLQPGQAAAVLQAVGEILAAANPEHGFYMDGQTAYERLSGAVRAASGTEGPGAGAGQGEAGKGAEDAAQDAPSALETP